MPSQVKVKENKNKIIYVVKGIFTTLYNIYDGGPSLIFDWVLDKPLVVLEKNQSLYIDHFFKGVFSFFILPKSYVHAIALIRMY